jgi:nucleoside-diphosphate-sugar epimerase
MARVFVIGGTGFIGSHAVRACVDAGHDVWVGAGTMRPGLLDGVRDRIQVVPGDLLHWSELLAGLRQCRPEVVVNCAAFGAGGAGLMLSAQRSPARAVELNVGGFTNLLEMLRLLEIPRLVWTGSSVVFGPAALYGNAPVDEEVISAPTTVYGATKVLAEFLMRHYRDEYGLEAVALRLPLVYGPGRWYVGQGGALHDLFAAAARRQQVTLHAPRSPMDLMYAADAGLAVAACVGAPALPHDRYHVVSHRSTIADLARQLTRLDPALRLTVEPVAGGPDLPAMSTARIERDLDFRPAYDEAAACADFLRWLRDHEGGTG